MPIEEFIYLCGAIMVSLFVMFVIWKNGKLKNIPESPKKESDGDEKDFVFIWCKKMINGNKTHYTAPFRTKVRAKTREQAKDKLTNFALQKMTLLIVEEKDFDSSELGRVQKSFDDISNSMDRIFNTAFKK